MNKKYKGIFIYFAALNASMGYANYGYCISVFNILEDYLQNFVFPDVGTAEFSLIASLFSIGAIAGSLLGDFVLSKLGRRNTMIFADILSMIGLILTIFSNIYIMWVGRFISGMVSGINHIVVPLYLLEISPIELSGSTNTVSVIALEVTAFITLTLSNAVPTSQNNVIWRLLYLLPVIFSIIRLVSLIFIFKLDTPLQYLQDKKSEQARKALSQIFYQESIEEEFNRIFKDVEAIKNSKEGEVKTKHLFSKKYRRAFLVAMTIAFLNQSCGTVAAFVFSNHIFSKSTDNPALFTTILGILSLVFVFISLITINRFGRRTIALTGAFCMGLLWFLAGLVASIKGDSEPSIKYFLVVWPIIFQLTNGSVVYLYISETMPEIGVSWCSFSNSVSDALVTQFYLPIEESWGLKGPFFLFSFTCLVAFVIFWFGFVETKGKSKNQIIGIEPTLIPQIEKVEPIATENDDRELEIMQTEDS